MDYVIDLESYAIVFVPREKDTEILQCERTEYSRAEGKQLFKNLLAQKTLVDQQWAPTAAFVFLALMRSDQLQATLIEEDGSLRWVVSDPVDQHVFEFSEPGRSAESPDDFCHDLVASGACLDLIQRLQPASSRYVVDELITPLNQAQSEFIQQKQAMDYLYQRGVFGRFDN